MCPFLCTFARTYTYAEAVVIGHLGTVYEVSYRGGVGVRAFFSGKIRNARERAEAVFCEIGYLGLLKFCCRLRIIS